MYANEVSTSVRSAKRVQVHVKISQVRSDTQPRARRYGAVHRRALKAWAVRVAPERTQRDRFAHRTGRCVQCGIVARATRALAHTLLERR